MALFWGCGNVEGEKEGRIVAWKLLCLVVGVSRGESGERVR